VILKPFFDALCIFLSLLAYSGILGATSRVMVSFVKSYWWCSCCDARGWASH
jgi:hypothetical protein